MDPRFSAPTHQSLYAPILLGGAPRGLAILNGTFAAALGLGLRAWAAGLAVFAVGQGLAAWAARHDPQILELARRHLRLPALLTV